MIHKAIVRDRVVHQAIVNVIEPLFEKHFIYDSYSCRVGKGTHAAVRRLRTFLRQASNNNTKTIYAVKCDVKKFFASVNHNILLTLLERRITCARTLPLLKNIISSFSVSAGKGIPLGNLTSQLFANIYLHELDWYAKQTLRVLHYIRYCDDFVMVVHSKSEAEQLVSHVNVFIQNQLQMRLHPNKIHVRTFSQGVDFLGYRILDHAVILRTGTKKRMVERINAENASSYLGICQHANSYGTVPEYRFRHIYSKCQRAADEKHEE
jgi:RNA-directed DNA polymerase